MFDAKLRPLIDPALNRIGQALAALGIGANGVTLAGMMAGLAGAFAIAQGHPLAGLGLIIANRLLDGLDGAVARATSLTDFGGYLDIVADFVFYVAVPVGFAFANDANQLAATLLLASFALTGTSFLAFATMAAKRGLETTAHGRKSFFYNTGLAEGGETIATFILMCVWPSHFSLIALVFATLCGLTVIQRSFAAWEQFR
jgi:phosphatidylglycerophosphate synthase